MDEEIIGNMKEILEAETEKEATNEAINKEKKPKQKTQGNKEDKENSKENKEQDKENDEEDKNPENDSEDKQREEIAKAKGIPSHDVLILREDSNFYKDHPEVEKNHYFYKDADGIVHAEYIDKQGQVKPSQYFEPSSTNIRQETISMGPEGKPIKREVPYQVMKTKNLNNVDKDIRDIRINVNIDVYGYLEIEEVRQGKNGEWLSHEIEVKGRDYNSRAVNEATSLRTRRANPDRQTNIYEKAENLEVEEDLEYNELGLVAHAEEFIQARIKEGYQREEGIRILNYCIGEEKLTLKEAKQKVNAEIERDNKEKRLQEEKAEKEQEYEEKEKTPWGDAEERARRRQKHN